MSKVVKQVFENKTVWSFEQDVHYDRIVYFDTVSEKYYLSSWSEIRNDSVSWETIISEVEFNKLLSHPELFQDFLHSNREWHIKKSWEKEPYIKIGILNEADGFINKGFGQFSV